MSNRQQRRARHSRGHQPPPVQVLVGPGMVAMPTGIQQLAEPMADLPPKRPGRHRWIATAGYVLDDDQAAAAYRAEVPKLLDNAHMFMLGVLCWDCEQPLAPDTPADGPCPAPADD